MIRELYNRYKTIISYVFWGGVTTLVNIAVYGICTYFGMPEMAANILAWVLSVIVAYLSNRRWVFQSGNHGEKAVLREFFSFMTCRIGTGLLDQLIMFVGVEWIGASYIPEDLRFPWGMLIKVISNVIVIILNYVLSRRVVFTKK